MATTTLAGWLHTLQEEQFGAELAKVLHPARTIQTREYLRGRAEQLDEIRRAWYATGRQIFIHGYRGVGKTSLAHTAAYQQQSSDGKPVMLACSEGSGFFDLIHDMVDQALPSDPRHFQKVTDYKVSAALNMLSGEMRSQIVEGRPPRPNTLNEAVGLTAFVAETHSGSPVVVIDEFDLLKSPEDHKLFADFVKQIGDQHINIRFVFCGIGESIEELFKAHASAHRYFHTVKLDRLDWMPRMEIVKTAADHLGIDIDQTTSIRLAMISDGFPHYVHLISEKLFWLVYRECQDGRVKADQYERALQQAADSMEPQLKGPYETATRKYTNDYEEILWAAADHYQLERRSIEIYQSYRRIMSSLKKAPLERDGFNNRMNRLKTDAYGSILTGTRAGWYSYTDKIIRGFARLRAAQSKVELEVDHPLQKRRFSE